MARPAYGGRTTCESCKSIDVRVWHCSGRLRAGQYFSWSWTRGGKPSGYINVQTELDAVALIYRVRSAGASEWKSIEQRVPIAWTACHFGGQRPWFICSVNSGGRYCGRRAAAGRHRARIGIRQRDLLVLARHHPSIQGVEALYFLA
jgi:hypothetical protein